MGGWATEMKEGTGGLDRHLLCVEPCQHLWLVERNNFFLFLQDCLLPTSMSLVSLSTFMLRGPLMVFLLPWCRKLCGFGVWFSPAQEPNHITEDGPRPGKLELQGWWLEERPKRRCGQGEHEG